MSARSHHMRWKRPVSVAGTIALVALVNGACGADNSNPNGRIKCPSTVPYVHLSEKALKAGKARPLDVKPFVRCTGEVYKVRIVGWMEFNSGNGWTKISGSENERTEYYVSAKDKVLVMATAPCYKGKYKGRAEIFVTVDGITSSSLAEGAVKDNPCRL